MGFGIVVERHHAVPIALEQRRAARMVHLEQVMANDDHLAALSAKARAEMPEPSRG